MDGSESDACYFMFPGPWLTSRARKGSRESIQMAEGLQPRGWSDKEHEGDTPTPLHPKIKKKVLPPGARSRLQSVLWANCPFNNPALKSCSR